MTTNPRIETYTEELNFDDFNEDTPPDSCPFCEKACTEAVRGDDGNWTWNCPEGCNP